MGRMKQLSPEERRLARRALYDALEAGELELPETVRRLREVAGMTQAEFGERIAGVSRLTISQIERVRSLRWPSAKSRSASRAA